MGNSLKKTIQLGLPKEDLVEMLHTLRDGWGWHEWALGRYLLEFDERSLYIDPGYSSTTQYCLCELKLSTKKAYQLLRGAKSLVNLPALDKAYADEKIPWSAVREVTRVAMPETEIRWVAYCQNKNVTQIERAVAAVNPGDLPPKDGPLRAKLNTKLSFPMPPEVQALWEQCVQRMSSATDEKLNHHQVFEELLKHYLSRPLNSDEMDKRQCYQGIIHHCSSCRESYMDTDSGPLKVPTEVAEKVMDQADIMDITPLEEKQKILEKSIGKPVPPSERDLPNTPEICRQVLARDGNRCVVPGCNRQGHLQAHHVMWRVNGGRTVLKNEIALCPSCHGLVHSGKLVITGTAPESLRFHRPHGSKFNHAPAGA